MPSAVAADMYLPALAFSAVLPLPNRSYTAPTRGVRSLNPVTLSFRPNLTGTGPKRVVWSVPLPPAGAQLVTRSYLRPPWSVSRPRVPISQTELDEVIRRHALFQAGRHGGQRAMLSYRDLSGLDLSGKNLSDGDLTAVTLTGARPFDPD